MSVQKVFMNATKHTLCALTPLDHTYVIVRLDTS